MICLDTNYLIRALVPDSNELQHLQRWQESGKQFSVTSIAWYEFLCGPVSRNQMDAIRGIITTELPFANPQSELASTLFNQAGRKLSTRVDCMIAATTISAGHQLATANTMDFEAFIPLGLQMASC